MTVAATMRISMSANDRPFGPVEWDAVQRLLPTRFIADAGRFRRWHDAQAHLIARLLVRRALHGADPSRLDDWRVSPLGRPFLPGWFDFSISHCDGIVVVATALRGRIGVDVEPVRRPFPMAVVNAVFDPIERRRVDAAAEPVRKAVRIWTVKEAVLKAMGEGLSAATMPVDEGRTTLAYSGTDWTIRTMTVGNDVSGDFVVTVASDAPEGIGDGEPHPRLIAWTDLLERQGVARRQAGTTAAVHCA